MSLFKTLSAINANEYKEKKGKFDYLSWTDAHILLETHAPGAVLELLEDQFYPDGSMEVRTAITIGDERKVMWLAVMDHQNRAIKNPDACAINKARMRCYVKNMALFGLGIYIFQGEDLPSAPMPSQDDYDLVIDMLAKSNALAFKEYFDRVGTDYVTSIFDMAPAGGKTKLKEQCRALYKTANEIITEYARQMLDMAENGDQGGVIQLWEELDEPTMEYVKARLGDVDYKAVEAVARG